MDGKHLIQKKCLMGNHDDQCFITRVHIKNQGQRTFLYLSFLRDQDKRILVTCLVSLGKSMSSWFIDLP